MTFDTHIPPTPLREFIALLWEWRGAKRTHAFERLMPNGEAALIVNLKEDAIRVYHPQSLALTGREPGAVLLGAYSAPSVIDCAEQDHVFGIQFHPGGAAPFLQMPVSELSNQHVALEHLWGAAGRDLRAELLQEGSSQSRFRAAIRHLLARLQPARNHPAVAAALQAIRQRRGGLRTGALAADLGLSERRFIELFERQVGLAPKAFCRLTRFQHALRALYRPTSQASGAEIALTAGYCDQSHMIHEFREMAGLSPAEYARSAGHHPNHVPIWDNAQSAAPVRRA